MGIYGDSGTNPSTLIVQSTSIYNISSAGWYDMDIPLMNLAAGNYWLAVMVRPENIGADNGPAITGAASGTGYQRDMIDAWGSLPTNFNGTSYPMNYDLHADYCTP